MKSTRIVCFAVLVFLAACSSNSNTTESPTAANETNTETGIDSVASQVCGEAYAQLPTLEGSNDIKISECSGELTSDDKKVFVIRLNDSAEWLDLTMTATPEELAFIIPLGLVAYSFAGASVDPDAFDLIAVAFDDPRQTVYSFTANDLAVVLRAQSQEDATRALLDLANKMSISALR